MKRIVAIITIVVSLCAVKAQDKLTDSLHVQIGTQVQVASEDFQPLWGKANRFGMASDRKFDQITWVEATNTNRLGEMKFWSDTASPVSLDYGVTAFNAEHYSRFVLQQAYAQLSYKSWFIRGGRHRDLWDDLDPMLSMGSLGTSGNALPIPKITIGMDDYVNIPWTNGLLQFKGMIGHGWLGDNRFMESLLHEKSFYGRVNLGKWKIYGGIQHYVEWGGRRPSEGIYLDRSLAGFFDVLFVSEANDGSLPTESEQAGVRPNRAGDQRGVAEFGIYYENDDVWVHAYNQTPFESGKGIDIRNMDRLLGVHIKSKKTSAFLQSIVGEFIYTKQMENFGGTERQSYYNNGAMKTGWEYENLVVGTPLMTSRLEASNYFPLIPYNWRGTDAIPGNGNITNSRIIGGNIAARFRLSEMWSMRAKLTPTVNYGSLSYTELYGDGLFECYSLVEFGFSSGRWFWHGNVAGDFGQLYNNIGGMLGVSYSLR